MMDRTSSYMTGKRIKEMHLDGAKLLWRWVPSGEKNDRYALETHSRNVACDRSEWLFEDRE